jgi:hypothetical protein
MNPRIDSFRIWIVSRLLAGVTFYACLIFILDTSQAKELPPGVPNPIRPDGKYDHRALMFTTKAYEGEAMIRVVQEVNQVAAQLQLPEQLPITGTNIIKAFINPFGYAYAKKAIGNVTTRHFAYYVSQGNKLSYIESPHQDELCRLFQASHTWPVDMIDTNQAYQLATQWLAAASMDVEALNRDCLVTVELDKAYVHPPAGKFVPVYDVCWSKREDKRVGMASVRLFTPTKTLLQLRVEDPKYIMRSPLVFTNLADLLSQTNEPVATQVLDRRK